MVSFLASLADFLGLADAYCFLRPLLKPYVRHDVSEFTPEVCGWREGGSERETGRKRGRRGGDGGRVEGTGLRI